MRMNISMPRREIERSLERLLGAVRARNLGTMGNSRISEGLR